MIMDTCHPWWMNFIHEHQSWITWTMIWDLSLHFTISHNLSHKTLVCVPIGVWVMVGYLWSMKSILQWGGSWEVWQFIHYKDIYVTWKWLPIGTCVSLRNFLPSFDEYFMMQPWTFQTQQAGSNFSSNVFLYKKRKKGLLGFFRTSITHSFDKPLITFPVTGVAEPWSSHNFS